MTPQIRRARDFVLAEGVCAGPAVATSNRDYRLEIDLPIFRQWTPGQFVMLRWGAHLVGRPFAIVDWKSRGRAGSRLSVWIRRLGAGTEELFAVARKGLPVTATLPLGQGMPPELLRRREPILFISGGVGGASILPLVTARKTSDPWIHGELTPASLDSKLAKSKTRPTILCFESALKSARKALGSARAKTEVIEGRVTAAIQAWSAEQAVPAAVVACGPSPMLRAVADAVRGNPILRELPVWLGLEEKMGCGIGLCFSCSVLTREGPERCCLEGPWFEASRIPDHFEFRTEGRGW